MADCVAGWRQSDTDWTVIDWSTPPSACEYITYTVGILHQDAIKNSLIPKHSREVMLEPFWEAAILLDQEEASIRCSLKEERAPEPTTQRNLIA